MNGIVGIFMHPWKKLSFNFIGYTDSEEYINVDDRGLSTYGLHTIFTSKGLILNHVFSFRVSIMHHYGRIVGVP